MKKLETFLRGHLPAFFFTGGLVLLFALNAGRSLAAEADIPIAEVRFLEADGQHASAQVFVGRLHADLVPTLQLEIWDLLGVLGVPISDPNIFMYGDLDHCDTRPLQWWMQLFLSNDPRLVRLFGGGSGPVLFGVFRHNCESGGEGILGITSSGDGGFQFMGFPLAGLPAFDLADRILIRPPEMTVN